MEKVIEEFGVAFFTNNISYMIPLAIMQGPKNIFLFGVDMYFGTKGEYMRNEKGCIEFWLGVATGRKIQIHLPAESTLLKRKGRSNFYGMKVEVDKNNHMVTLTPEYTMGRSKCAREYRLVRKASIF